MPDASAIWSTLSSVISSSSCARRIRCECSHCNGVVPVTALNNLARCRELMFACLARSSTVIVRSSRADTQPNSSVSGCPSPDGTGARTNCACPPSRCGGTTSLRAAVLAVTVPWSPRIRCRLRSIAAALPALVITRPLST